MKCRSIRFRLSQLADNELAAHEKTQLERHIQICPSCAAELQDYRAIKQLLVAPAPIEASPWLWVKIRQRLPGSREVRRFGVLARLRPVLIPLGAAAALVMAIITAGQLTQTINVASRDAQIQPVNLPPEENSVPVIHQGNPSDSLEDDSLDFEP